MVVEEQEEQEEEAGIGRQRKSVEEEEIGATALEGLLLLPPQLQKLLIHKCPELSLHPDSLDDELALRGGGLQGLCSLRSLKISDCPKFLSSYLLSSSCFPFPTSLQQLTLSGLEGMETLEPLTNLASLTKLEISWCGDIRAEGLWQLLSHGCLIELSVSGAPNFFVGSEPSQLHEQDLSSNLQKLATNDIAGFFVTSICRLLSSSLTKLEISDSEMESFTKEQDEALQLLTALQELVLLSCENLRYLPARVCRLPNLKILEINYCKAIHWLPKEGLPNSLEELSIYDPTAIRTLPKHGLPSSLRRLNVSGTELNSQARKLIGTIPIVWTNY
ncbi:hypothetical protein ACP4OV_031222 [Aristida adscensionis]